jgi:CubicO group peptidase (beta-lactamase class C family)
MTIARFSGVRLVTRSGSVLACEPFGLADRAAAVRWSSHTSSQIASISKQFVAVVSVLLAERGVLALDNAVGALLPEAPTHWRAVTLEHLLTHTSGLPHWGALAGFDPAVPMDPAQRLPHLLDAALVSEPGAAWRYSSPGYIVLSAVLAHVTRRDYADLARELIIDKLALEGTTVASEPIGALARGYRDGQPVAPWDLSGMPGTGDVWSTAFDVAAFVTAVHDGGLLPPRAQELLRGTSVPLSRTRDEASPVVASRYGLGHFIGSVNGQDARLHPGDNPGYQALAAWLPSTGTAVVVLSNDETDDVEAVLSEAAAGLGR